MKKSNQKNVLIKKKQLHNDQKYSKRQTRKTIDSRQRIYLTPALSLFASLVLAEITYADWLMECGSCHCKWNSGKKTADCRNSSLFAIPNNLSPEVQVLDLSHNHIPSMEPNVFLMVNLHNLHKLYIRNSSLERVDPQSFSDLRILIEVDLSNNLLRDLESNQFHHLIKIRAILLNNNLLESLSDGVFQDLTHLHRIELRGNRLTHVAIHVFTNLPLLSQIYLDENRLRFLRKESFERLERLTALSLDHNPWNCSCNLQPFRDFVIQRNLYTPPTSCHYPSHLRGTLWNEDNSEEAFVCKPKILHLTKETPSPSSSNGENTTLICRVHASQNTQITWTYNKQNIRSSPAYFAKRLRISLHYEEHSSRNLGRRMLISRLTIFRAEKTDEGTYTCVAENAGGKGSLQFSFLVKPPSSEGEWSFEGNSAAVIGVAALGLLSVCLLLFMAAYFFYKKSNAFKDSNSHQHIVLRGVQGDTQTANSSTNLGASYEPNRKDESVREDGDVKIYSNYSLKDESDQIKDIRSETSTQVHSNAKDEIDVEGSKSCPSKKLRSNKGNKDAQLNFCRTDFQPDLVLAYSRGVDS